MKRLALLSLTSLLAFGCSCMTHAPGTPVPAPEPVAAAAAPEPSIPCIPGNAIVNATLWMQSAAEYRAAAIGTYAAAQRALDAALADPSWSAVEGQTNAGSLPPAVILDLDETAIDNSVFEARSVKVGKTFDNDLWKQWVEESAARAVPGAAEFLAYAASKGVTPFYITNRDFDPEGPGTQANVEKLGFPMSKTVDTLLMRGERPEWKSDKGSRRDLVAQRYRVLLLLGDDLNDFANARDLSVADRDALFARTTSWWGTRWFMIPNAIYGSWERSVAGSGTDCEKLQKKIDALRVQ